jgi:hypothetical protein
MKNIMIEKATTDKVKIAKEYGISESNIVWIGDNHYIIVKDGNEIRI